MTVMLPSASASAFIWFIMWTKNGKFSPGTDSRMVSGLSACAKAERGERQAERAGQQCHCKDAS